MNSLKNISITLDINRLKVSKVEVDGEAVEFAVGPEKKYLGQALTIPITSASKQVSISYTTDPEAGALLWVEGDKPFLFTQSQAILGRTWLPCQDSPGVRYTYNAKVKVREDLMALMSAENPQEINKPTFHWDRKLISLGLNIDFTGTEK